MRNTPVFPLAKLIPTGVLTIFGAISAWYILNTDEYANGWAATGLLPLIAYLGACLYRARKMILAESGREREIVQMGFIAMVAERSARFWSFLFSAVATVTCVLTVAIWAYQCFLWYREEHWITLSWLSIGGAIPSTRLVYLQRLLYWLGDTNIGVVVLVCGLLLAAPLAAINWRSNNKARFRRNELGNLRKRS